MKYLDRYHLLVLRFTRGGFNGRTFLLNLPRSRWSTEGIVQRKEHGEPVRLIT